MLAPITAHPTYQALAKEWRARRGLQKVVAVAALVLSAATIRYAPTPLKCAATLLGVLSARLLYRLSQKPILLLACSGGGSRAIYTIEVLRLLQAAAGVRLHDRIDLYAGTSAGVFPAGGIAVGMNPAEILTHFEQSLPEVFQKSLRQDIETGWGLFAPRFTPEGLKNVIHKIMGNRTMNSTSKYYFVPTGIKSNDINNAYFVRSPQGVGILPGNDKDFISTPDLPLEVPMRATTAAETYFPSEPLKDLGGLQAVDGGTAPNLNNPVAQAVNYFLPFFPGREIRVLSIGTGYVGYDWTGVQSTLDYLKDGKVFGLRGNAAMASELDKVRSLGIEVLHFDVEMSKAISLDDTDVTDLALLKKWADLTPKNQAADWAKAISWLKP